MAIIIFQIIFWLVSSPVSKGDWKVAFKFLNSPGSIVIVFLHTRDGASRWFKDIRRTA